MTTVEAILNSVILLLPMPSGIYYLLFGDRKMSEAATRRHKIYMILLNNKLILLSPDVECVGYFRFSSARELLSNNNSIEILLFFFTLLYPSIASYD